MNDDALFAHGFFVVPFHASISKKNIPALSSITLSCSGSEDILILGATLHGPMYLALGKSSLGILEFRDFRGVCVSLG